MTFSSSGRVSCFQKKSLNYFEKLKMDCEHFDGGSRYWGRAFFTKKKNWNVKCCNLTNSVESIYLRQV